MGHQPGLPELAIGGPPQARERSLGEKTIRRYDLTKYYDLSTPGKYFVDMEFLDDTEHWSRPSTVQVEIQAVSEDLGNEVRHVRSALRLRLQGLLQAKVVVKAIDTIASSEVERQSAAHRCR
jgi:hypothetical protein